MMDNYDAFIKVIKKDPKKRNNINILLDRYMSLTYDFQSTIGYNSLMQNDILKELINIISLIKLDSDIELKRKIRK